MRKKDSILLFIGFTILFFGIFIFIVGLGMMVDSNKKNSSTGLPVAILSTSIIIPGIILIHLGKKAKKEKELLISIVSIVKSYRRITLTDVAQKLNIPIPTAAKLLSNAISLKLIEGVFDRTTDEFFTDDAKDQKVEFKFCPSCGAALDKIYLEGDTIKCQTCGVLVR